MSFRYYLHSYRHPFRNNCLPNKSRHSFNKIGEHLGFINFAANNHKILCEYENTVSQMTIVWTQSMQVCFTIGIFPNGKGSSLTYLTFETKDRAKTSFALFFPSLTLVSIHALWFFSVSDWNISSQVPIYFSRYFRARM